MAHRITFEERSGCDPSIVGRRIYSLDEHYLGIATANWRSGGGICLITVDVGDPQARPVVIKAAKVLVEAPRKLPGIRIVDDPPVDDPDPPADDPPADDTDGLAKRDRSGHPIHSSPERERATNRVFEEAGVAAREEGVSDDENPLPLADAPISPSGPRIGGPIPGTEATGFPAGKPMWRNTDPDATPPMGMPIIQGGSTMASVAEVKAAIEAAMQSADEAAAAVRTGIDRLSEAQQQLAAALEGGSHNAIHTSNAALAHANQQFEEGIQAIQGAKEAASGYGSGL